MSVLTTNATYTESEGFVKPFTKPDFEVGEVVVMFVPKFNIKAVPHNDRAIHQPKGNASDVLKALERMRGMLPSDIDGVEYENAIRKEAEQHFKDLNW